MTKLVLTAVSLIALLTVSGCVGIGKGKGKGPPPPDVTSDYDQGVITLYCLGRPIRDVATEYGCFGRSAQCRRWLATRSA